jgi:hypothetical protein
LSARIYTLVEPVRTVGAVALFTHRVAPARCDTDPDRLDCVLSNIATGVAERWPGT